MCIAAIYIGGAMVDRASLRRALQKANWWFRGRRMHGAPAGLTLDSGVHVAVRVAAHVPDSAPVFELHGQIFGT